MAKKIKKPRKSKIRILILGSARKPEVRKRVEEILPALKRRAKIVDVLFAEGANLSKIDADLVLVFGGDGTIISTARMLNGNVAPVLGVNFGRRGFLAESEPDTLLKDLKCFIDGKTRIGKRMMIQASLMYGKKVLKSFKALNDVVLSSLQFARMVHLRLNINGTFVHEYPCDGLIISTPTGSTAHALSAGGPILPPESRSFIVVPIASHAFVDRPIVVPATQTLQLTLGPDTKNASVTFDGQHDIPIRYGETLQIKKSAKDFRVVELGHESFYDVVRRKLSWGGEPICRT